MKNCNEMVDSLLERRERYVAEQKRKRAVITRSAAAVCCVCLIALLGFGVWNGTFEKMLPVAPDNSVAAGPKANSEHSEFTANQASETGDSEHYSIAQTPETGNKETDSDSIGSADVGNYPNNFSPNGNEKTMISSYDGNGMLPEACYEAPENGKFYFSIPLRYAMDAYGDSVKYRVVVDVFTDKEQLSPNSSQVKDEGKRLSDNGYIVAYETFFDGESNHYYFTLHATYEELIAFQANAGYGYFMFLYDEGVDAAYERVEESTPQFNGWVNNETTIPQ